MSAHRFDEQGEHLRLALGDGSLQGHDVAAVIIE